MGDYFEGEDSGISTYAPRYLSRRQLTDVQFCGLFTGQIEEDGYRVSLTLHSAWAQQMALYDEIVFWEETKSGLSK
jgi:hypothetical protein